MKITFMGSGTSHGIPMVGCGCPVCRSADPHDKRTRCSILLTENGPRRPGTKILIDTATEFRLQAVRERLCELHAVFFTHAHADHLHGLDDIRPFTREHPMPLYGTRETLDELREHYAYLFRQTQEGGGKADVTLHTLDRDPVQINGISVLPIPLLHGTLPVRGYRVGSLAYLTDCSGIPEESYSLLQGITLLVIDALRERRHSTHFSFGEAEAVVERIAPEKAFFTHICHDTSHKDLLRRYRGTRIAPACDGLTLDFVLPGQNN